jgi:RimJ/RimL family protein N-acetyltransferase
MGKLVPNDDKRVAEWVAARIPVFEFGSSPYTAIGWANQGGLLVAGVIYQNYIKTNIEVHIATVGRRWASREYLGEIVRYPFDQLGCERMTALVPAKNARSQHFCEHFGFTWEGRMRRILADGDDLIVYGMLREECRWLTIGLKRGYHYSTAGYRRRA